MKLLVLLLIAVATAQLIQLEARGLDTGRKIHLGHVDSETATLVQDEVDVSLDEKYCIGTGTDNCVTVTAFQSLRAPLSDKQILLYLDPLEVSLLNGGQGDVQVREPTVAPKPNLNPKSLKKAAKKPEPKVIKKIVENENGEQIEVEEQEEEDNRSWIQKNWIWIVTPLILFLLVTDDKKE